MFYESDDHDGHEHHGHLTVHIHDGIDLQRDKPGGFMAGEMYISIIRFNLVLRYKHKPHFNLCAVIIKFRRMCARSLRPLHPTTP